MDVLAQLERLESIFIMPIHCQTSWSRLAELKALTELTFIDSVVPVGNEYMRVLPSLAGLKRLSIQNPSLFGAEFAPVFCAPSLRLLHFMRLDCFVPSVASPPAVGRLPVSKEDFQAVCKNLVLLRKLELVNFAQVETFLPELVHAAAIEDVLVEPQLNPNCDGFASTCPQISTIVALLAGKPRLDLCVLLRRELSCEAESVQRSYEDKLRVRYASSEELRSLRSRFRLHSTGVQQIVAE